MKLINLFTFFQSVFSVPLSLNSSMMNKYNEYIEQYGKEFSYDNFEIFKKNLMIIENINSKNNSYTVQVKIFSDVDKMPMRKFEVRKK